MSQVISIYMQANAYLAQCYARKKMYNVIWGSGREK